MTPERARDLIRAGESLDVEFTGEQARRLSDGAVWKTTGE